MPEFVMKVPRTRLVPGDRARLTTTLNLLKARHACEERYKHLVQALGGTSYDHDKPINLLTILDLNGTADCLWALCATATIVIGLCTGAHTGALEIRQAVQARHQIWRQLGAAERAEAIRHRAFGLAKVAALGPTVAERAGGGPVAATVAIPGALRLTAVGSRPLGRP